MKFKYLLSIVLLLNLLLTPLVSAIESPFSIKNNTISKLESAKTGDKFDKGIDRVIENIKASFEDAEGSLWLDEWHLVSAPRGKKVFHEEKQAIMRIQEQNNKKDIPEELKALYIEVTNDLLKADELLAVEMVNISKKFGGINETIDHQIDMAERKLAEAYEELEANTPHKANKYFERAWDHAQHATKILIECPELRRVLEEYGYTVTDGNLALISNMGTPEDIIVYWMNKFPTYSTRSAANSALQSWRSDWNQYFSAYTTDMYNVLSNIMGGFFS